MKALKAIGSVIIVLLLVVIVLGIALPKNVTINRSVTIDAPASTIFEHVNDLRAWASWSPWLDLDPNLFQADNFKGESGLGQRYCWDSNHQRIGSGCMEIVNSEPHRRVTTQLEFGDMGSGTGEWLFTEKRDGLTEVQWTMHADIGEPVIVGPLMGVVMDGFVGEMFESGLANLKEVSENPGQGLLSGSENRP